MKSNLNKTKRIYYFMVKPLRPQNLSPNATELLGWHNFVSLSSISTHLIKQVKSQLFSVQKKMQLNYHNG